MLSDLIQELRLLDIHVTEQEMKKFLIDKKEKSLEYIDSIIEDAKDLKPFILLVKASWMKRRSTMMMTIKWLLPDSMLFMTKCLCYRISFSATSFGRN
jgi:hypothetical protein